MADHQGTIRDVVNSAGTVVDHRVYDSFGNLTSQTGPAVDFIFGYTGQAWDELASLYDYGRRWYDPAVGRFASEDPTGFDAGDLNLYRYVGNNPLNLIDPTGLCSSAYSSWNNTNLWDSPTSGSNYSSTNTWTGWTDPFDTRGLFTNTSLTLPGTSSAASGYRAGLTGGASAIAPQGVSVPITILGAPTPSERNSAFAQTIQATVPPQEWADTYYQGLMTSGNPVTKHDVNNYVNLANAANGRQAMDAQVADWNYALNPRTDPARMSAAAQARALGNSIADRQLKEKVSTVVAYGAAGVAVGAAATGAVVLAAPAVVAAGSMALWSAGTSATVAVTVPQAAVTVGLTGAAAYGAYRTGTSMHENYSAGNMEGLAYDVGTLVGGGLVGVGGGGRYLAEGMMRTPSPAPNTWNPLSTFRYEVTSLYNPRKGPPGIEYWATCPDPAGGGGMATFISSGINSTQSPKKRP